MKKVKNSLIHPRTSTSSGLSESPNGTGLSTASSLASLRRPSAVSGEVAPDMPTVAVNAESEPRGSHNGAENSMSVVSQVQGEDGRQDSYVVNDRFPPAETDASTDADNFDNTEVSVPVADAALPPDAQPLTVFEKLRKHGRRCTWRVLVAGAVLLVIAGLCMAFSVELDRKSVV